MSSYLVTYFETVEHYVLIDAINRDAALEAAHEYSSHGRYDHECGDDCSSRGWDVLDVAEEPNEPDRMP